MVMTKAYWVTTYRPISDPEKLAAYEAGLKERIVISEFPRRAGDRGP
jgi:hypothetical protein